MCAVVPGGTCVCMLCALRRARSRVRMDAVVGPWSHGSLGTLVPFLYGTGLRAVETIRVWGQEMGRDQTMAGSGQGLCNPMLSAVSSLYTEGSPSLSGVCAPVCAPVCLWREMKPVLVFCAASDLKTEPRVGLGRGSSLQPPDRAAQAEEGVLVLASSQAVLWAGSSHTSSTPSLQLSQTTGSGDRSILPPLSGPDEVRSHGHHPGQRDGGRPQRRAEFGTRAGAIGISIGIGIGQ